MALIRIHRGDRQGDTIHLNKDKTVLGREKTCDEIISLKEIVSRRHAVITHVDGKWFIEDISHNGIELNGTDIPKKTPVPLHDRDSIRICEVFVGTFLDQDAPLEGSSTVEATLSSGSDHNLETQPAAKLALLLEIIARLGQTLNLDSQLPEVADGMLRIFLQADRCFIILLDDDSETLIPKVIRTRRHVDESKQGYSRTIVLQCLRSGQAILLREGDDISSNSGSVSAFHIRSVMCVPLRRADGTPFGVIQLDTQDGKKKFTEDDLKLLWGVSYQASAALENARLHTLTIAQERVKNELDLASQVQRNFLPREVPGLPGYEFFAYYEAAREVGGDYYDFLPLGENRLAVALGDVAGKGMPAALLMAKLAAETRSCLLTEKQLTTAIAKLNDNLYPATSPMDRFVTLVAAVLDPTAHRLTFVNAGHLAPLWFRRAEGRLAPAIPAEIGGPSLGLEMGCHYRSFTIEIEPGDFVLLYSDGVTDAQSIAGKSFKMRGIHGTLEKCAPESATDFGKRLVEEVRLHAAGGQPHDDITLVCLGRPLK